MNQEPDEYEDARRLLAPLASEPTGPSMVDISRAVADGRRRLRTRRIAGVGAMAVAAALVAAGVPVVLDGTRNPVDSPAASGEPPPTASPSPTPTGPPPPTECELARLPEAEGADQSLVTAGDPTGRFLAGRYYFPADGAGNLAPQASVQVVIWDRGDPVTIDIPGYDASLDAITSSGVAVGSSFESYDGDEGEQSWIYQDGQLDRLAGENVEVSAINEHGVVVGTQGYPDWPVPVVWRSPTADPEQLALPGDDWEAVANDIDDDGTIVGTGFSRDEIPDPPDHALVWLPDGTRQEIPVPLIDGEPAAGFRADSIHDGVVTGLATELVDDRGSIAFRVFQYDLATGEFTELDPGFPMGVESWSANGWLVGNTADGLRLVAGSEVVPLPYPQPPEDPEQPSIYQPVVVAVSDDGMTVAGQIWDEEGAARAVAWYCR